MKKFLMIGFLTCSLSGFGFAEETAAPVQAATATKAKPPRKKKKKVIKSGSAAPQAPKTSVKLEDAKKDQKPKQSDSLQAWLKDLKKRVSHSQSQQNQIVAVAAVRGAETPDSPPLYWKGRLAEGPTNKPELKDFESAIDTAMTSDPAAAKEKLQSFILAYPKSSLAADAQETLNRLDAPVTDQ